MEIIGAINLYNNHCIDSLETDYTIIEDCRPISLAVKWNNIGVNWIHLVDVNAVWEGMCVNKDLIKDIISKVNVPIQLAGGIDNIESFEEMLASGASRIVLDNKILKNSDFVDFVLREYPDKTAILFNVDSGMIQIDDGYHENLIDIVENLKNKGLQQAIYRDISTNYELNYDDIIALAKNTGIPLTVCGKLNNIESIKKLKEINKCEELRLKGIILSKPLYDNTLDLFEVIKLIGAYPYVGDFYSREDIC
jgi:phosphoribosylformimino-5-aminoimidazole carboxamide ribotide isomerase